MGGKWRWWRWRGHFQRWPCDSGIRPLNGRCLAVCGGAPCTACLRAPSSSPPARACRVAVNTAAPKDGVCPNFWTDFTRRTKILVSNRVILPRPCNRLSGPSQRARSPSNCHAMGSCAKVDLRWTPKLTHTALQTLAWQLTGQRIEQAVRDPQRPLSCNGAAAMKYDSTFGLGPLRRDGHSGPEAKLMQLSKAS